MGGLGWGKKFMLKNFMCFSVPSSSKAPFSVVLDSDWPRSQARES